MKKYEQLNLHQGYQIQALLKIGSSKGEIAEILEVPPLPRDCIAWHSGLFDDNTFKNEWF